MSLKIKSDQASEGRLKAAAQILNLQPDLVEAFLPFIFREVILARINEARNARSTALTGRINELSRELANCEKHIPKEQRL